MVQEHRADYPSLWAAIESIAPKIGCVPQTLNDWVKKAEVDSGQRPAPPPRMRSASRNWSVRSKNCAGPTTS
jgi:transposase-like protein